MNLKKGKLASCIVAILMGSSSVYGQYNVDHLIGPTQENPVHTSVTEVGNGQLISVGTITSSGIGTGTHKDITLTKTDATGNVIWHYRYGQSDQDETGNGIILSWDEQHVIVVGSMFYNGASDIGNNSLRDAITLKVRISDGALIWTTTHGTFSNDEEAFLIEKTNYLSIGGGAAADQSYIVVGQSSGDIAQSYNRMYAFKLTENGGEIWSKRYLLKYNFPINSVRPTSMVKNGFNKLMIAGVQSEINRPTTLFTTGISTINGSVTDDYIDYSISNIYNVKECAIAKDADGSGYALAFTTDYFNANCFLAKGDQVPNSVDRIGVISLFPNRSEKWTSMYWDPNAENQSGLAIDITGNYYNVATSYNVNQGFVDRPGFLRINKGTSSVIDCHIYYSSSANPLGVQANCMIPANGGGYILKNFVAPNNGFSVIKVNNVGESNCDQTVRIVRCTTSSVGTGKKSSAVNYGSVALNFSPKNISSHWEQNCSSPSDGKSMESSEEIKPTKIKFYPSPIDARHSEVNVEFDATFDNKEANIHVYNAMGQEVLVHQFTMVEGENRTRFNPEQLTAGMYTLVIKANNEIIDRSKFLKQ